MGINHDNDHPSCADGVHIMSGEWIKGQNLGDVSWSQCSREDLERFLRYIIQEKNSYFMSFRNRCNKYTEIISFQFFLLLWRFVFQNLSKYFKSSQSNIRFINICFQQWHGFLYFQGYDYNFIYFYKNIVFFTVFTVY